MVKWPKLAAAPGKQVLPPDMLALINIEPPTPDAAHRASSARKLRIFSVHGLCRQATLHHLNLVEHLPGPLEEEVHTVTQALRGPALHAGNGTPPARHTKSR